MENEDLDGITAVVCKKCDGRGTRQYIFREHVVYWNQCDFCCGYGWVDWIHIACGGRPAELGTSSTSGCSVDVPASNLRINTVTNN